MKVSYLDFSMDEIIVKKRERERERESEKERKNRKRERMRERLVSLKRCMTQIIEISKYSILHTFYLSHSLSLSHTHNLSFTQPLSLSHFKLRYTLLILTFLT